MAKLIFGCGYLGSRVATRWHAAGEKVYAVTRSAKRAEEFAAAGWQPVVANITEPARLADLPPARTVLFAVGYDRGAEASMRQVYVKGLVNVLDALPDSVERFIYISSTGVFGQSAGEWVDEQSPTEPTREGGRICLEAEQTLLHHRLGRQSIILRMAGLYGPGRVPRVGDVRRGTPISAAADGYINLIHIDDAASIVLLAEHYQHAPGLFVVSDGRPTSRRDFYREIARQLGTGQPAFTVPSEANSGRSKVSHRSYGSNKRVRNDKLLREFRPALQYPSFREGLAQVLHVERDPMST